MEDFLEERGIRTSDMVSAYLELFIPHPGVEDKERATAAFEKELEVAFSDINICSLVMAGFRLEEDAKEGRIPGLNAKDFADDAVHILADEVLGMAIAEYIGGTRARFEFVRYDIGKPGILGSLGPFIDDAVCGLIAGISSKVYTDCGKE
jgi:alpha-ribazole phosphatase CobZ